MKFTFPDLANTIIALSEKPAIRVLIFNILFALFLFSPVLISGQVMVGSTDNLNHIFPNMLFSWQSFQAGEWGLWNPYILGGIDFSASTQNFIYFPLNWPLFLLPRSWFFQLITLKMFFEVIAAGFFSFLFFREELQNNRWAFWATVVYQAGGYMFFSITTYANLTLYWLIPLLLFVIWTYPGRRPVLSLLYIVACVTSILFAINIVYSFAALLLVGLAFYYRNFPLSLKPFSRADGGLNHVFYIGVAAGFLIGAIRTVPVILDVVDGIRYDLIEIRGRGQKVYYAISALVPEFFGVHYKSSIPRIDSLHAETGHGSHAQFHAMSYYGVPALILALYSFFVRKRAVLFWGGLLFFSFCVLVKIQPIYDFISILIQPLNHMIVPKMIMTIPLCLTAAYAGMYLEEQGRSQDPQNVIAFITVSMSTLLAFMFVSEIWLNPRLLNGARILVFLLLGTAVLALYLRRQGRLGVSFFGWFSCGVGLWLLLRGVSLFLDPEKRAAFLEGYVDNELFHAAVHYQSASILGLLLVFPALLWFARSWKGTLVRRPFILVLAGCAGAFLAVLLLPYAPMSENAAELIPFLYTFGLLRFILIFLIFGWAMLKMIEGRVKPQWIFSLLVVLSLIDLLPYNKLYSNQIVRPFFDEPVYSADRVDSRIELKNYRVNNSRLFTTFYDRHTNIAGLYGIRSTGGVNSSMPYGTFKMAESFLGDEAHGLGIPTGLDAKFERYLDLLGVGYDFSEREGWVRRENSLARFMLFQDYIVVSGGANTLAKLKEPGFVLRRQLVLDRSPGIESRSDRDAIVLDYDEIKTSEIRIDLESDARGLVFFNDAYHGDWLAYVNDQERPILRANFNFMAVEVPPGKSKVVFKFRPRNFYYGAWISLVGLFLLVAGMFWVGFMEKKYRVSVPADG